MGPQAMRKFTELSTALAVLMLLSGPALAVPTAAPEGQSEGNAEVAIGSPTLNDAAPVLLDGSSTIDLSAPVVGPPEGSATNSIVGAAALSPDRCAIPVELPAEGEAAATPRVTGEGAERECAELVDAVPMMITPAGGVPIAGASGVGSTDEELLLRLGERREGLEAEEAKLDQQALLLDAAAKRIEERTAELTALEQSINALVDTRDQKSQEEIAAMVSLYQNMKPQDAALVMSGLPDEVLLRIASNMSPRKMSPIMAAMNTTRAQALTVLMIEKGQEAQP